MKTLTLSLALVAAAVVQAPQAARQAQPAPSTQQQVSEGLKLQAGRAERVVSRGKKAYYTRPFDLGGLPAYEPAQRVTGTIRMWGSNYLKDGNLADYWDASFRKFHPGLTFEYQLKTSLAAVPALVTGVADLGPNRKITFAETLLYERYFNRDPLEIVFATGSFDVPGWQPAYGIIVHKNNPIADLTMGQLDGIFGAARRGGWSGTSWHPEFARGPEENIRTWSQLGLKGDWAGKRINVYGLNLRYHQATVISDMLLKSSDKWNEDLRIYANEILPDGTFGRLMVDDLVADPYCIAYVAAPTVNLPPELKLVRLAAKEGGPFVSFTIESVQNRTYPMADEVYMYANVQPGTGVDPKVKEFLRFILSREGQQDVMRDGKYLPLTPELAREQLKKLEER
jgi:phosphate transport system substrate-binding protein